MKSINLAKCKVGQRLQMRNGDFAILNGVESRIEDNQPYLVRHEDENKEVDPYCYTSSGSFYSSGKSQFDIIAIVHFPKKKAKTAKANNLTETAKLVLRLKGAMNVVNGLVKELEASL